MDVVWEFFFDVGRRETFTLISLTFMDVVEEVFANTLRRNVLDFSHVLLVCSTKTLSSLAARRRVPSCVFVLSLLVCKFSFDNVAMTDARLCQTAAVEFPRHGKLKCPRGTGFLHVKANSATLWS